MCVIQSIHILFEAVSHIFIHRDHIAAGEEKRISVHHSHTHTHTHTHHTHIHE